MDSGEEELLKGLADYARFGVTRVVGSTISNPFETIIEQVGRMRKVMADRTPRRPAGTARTWRGPGWPRAAAAGTTCTT